MRRWLVGGAAGVCVGAAAVLGLNSWVSRWGRAEIVAQLERKYASHVTFQSLEVSVFPRVRARGTGFVLRHEVQPGAPPLISFETLSVHGSWWNLVRAPRHIDRVRLEGLKIMVPPKRGLGGGKSGQSSSAAQRRTSPVVVDELVSDNTLLLIFSKKPGKAPLRFDIRRLRMQSIGLDRPAPFEGALVNPKPKGEIHTKGSFGPWNTDDPGQTPLQATYTFTNADMSTFRGLAGILSSRGKFAGVLEHIVVDGETHTPDFTVHAGGHAMPLDTVFHAIVDGTNGDTLLQPVRARIANSPVVAKGGVVKPPAGKGRVVVLDVTVENARLEDLMRLAVKGKPPMTGLISFKTAFELPPGEEEISRKLRLDGRFGVASASFTSSEVQRKVAGLSKAGRGEPEEQLDPTRVVSNLKGRFVLRDGIVRFPELSFEAPGAVVRLAGAYELESQKMDFKGSLELQAKLSETTTGVKSFFLKLVDPLFRRRDKGAVVPIKITGTRAHPEFGLDTGRLIGGR